MDSPWSLCRLDPSPPILRYLADLENLIGAEVSVRTTNANDRTVEGLDVVGRPAFSVQFHPESRPGPHDAAEEFERFVEMIELVRGGV